MGSYIPSTKEQINEMLNTLNIKSSIELFSDVPQNLMLNKFDLDHGVTEPELIEYATKLANKNKVYSSIFRGAGAYNHYIPSIVKRVTAKEEFITAYTPYQAEISQGILQTIFEYQSMICALTGMDASNASVYDGATAAAEAVAMCREKNKNRVIVSDTINPMVLETIKTYCFGNGMEVFVIPSKDGKADTELLTKTLVKGDACVYAEEPNFYGIIEDYEEIANIAHEVGAKFIMGVNPIAVSVLKTPAEYGADIAVGEGQPLGMPLSFGGPYLGFMACKSALSRKLPGRIAGETVDSKGERCFVLTLQAREQHIRREKASSNICSNQAHCAMTATAYMSTLGAKGMSETAMLCYDKAHYLAKELTKIDGFNLKFTSEFFHEFLTTCPVDADKLLKYLSDSDILGGLNVNGDILWCATEQNSKEDIDNLIIKIKEALNV